MIGMNDDNVDPNLIAVPADGVKTTQKEFEKLRDAMRKDPNAFMKAGTEMAGGHFTPGPVCGSPGVSNINILARPGTVINNPIELPEKP